MAYQVDLEAFVQGLITDSDDPLLEGSRVGGYEGELETEEGIAEIVGRAAVSDVFLVALGDTVQSPLEDTNDPRSGAERQFVSVYVCHANARGLAQQRTETYQLAWSVRKAVQGALFSHPDTAERDIEWQEQISAIEARGLSVMAVTFYIDNYYDLDS